MAKKPVHPLLAAKRRLAAALKPMQTSHRKGTVPTDEQTAEFRAASEEFTRLFTEHAPQIRGAMLRR